MLKGYKEFALKSNIIDVAIGVVIGGAFGKIVTSLVNDILMPIVGLFLGKVDLSNLFIALGGGNFNTVQEAKKAGVATINFGLFINNIIDFLIITLSIYIVFKQMIKFTKKNENNNEIKTKECQYCLNDINVKATRCPSCTSILE
ncbi:MAG: large-conductance mechanosensitive channel [Bacillales bacterium]|jgi:large conductance mechanosensitive channel|nr:large-conductance mechanosensitive channel [Bacillales bacterium]